MQNNNPTPASINLEVQVFKDSVEMLEQCASVFSSAQSHMMQIINAMKKAQEFHSSFQTAYQNAIATNQLLATRLQIFDTVLQHIHDNCQDNKTMMVIEEAVAQANRLMQ